MIGLKKKASGFAWRDAVREEDIGAVRELVRAADVFNEEEIRVAGELVEDRLLFGDMSEFHFLFADMGSGLGGYTCYARIPLTEGRYDLFWIVVAPAYQKTGLGQALLRETEQRVRAAGGVALYAETSGRDLYAPAHAFYEKNGFKKAALLPDFYRDGDDKVIYWKVL